MNITSFIWTTHNTFESSWKLKTYYFRTLFLWSSLFVIEFWIDYYYYYLSWFKIKSKLLQLNIITKKINQGRAKWSQYILEQNNRLSRLYVLICIQYTYNLLNFVFCSYLVMKFSFLILFCNWTIQMIQKSTSFKNVMT